MADLPPYSTPRWVKILAIITLVLVLLLGALHLSGIGGNHGPAQHLPSGSGTPLPSSLTVRYVWPDEGHGGPTRLIAYGMHRS